MVDAVHGAVHALIGQIAAPVGVDGCLLPGPRIEAPDHQRQQFALALRRIRSCQNFFRPSHPDPGKSRDLFRSAAVVEANIHRLISHRVRGIK